jgi:hypothetical protein
MIARLAGFLFYPTAKTWAAVSPLPFLAQIDFNQTINLGGIIVGGLVLAFGLLFTIRSNVAKVWRETAEGEKERARQLEEERDEQRRLKHEAINERNALRLKTDQTIVLKQMADDQREIVAQLAENHRLGLEKGAELLAQTETRLLDQIGTITRAQADLAVIVDRVVSRLDQIDQRAA